jgi:methionyl aminopeptidase
MMIIKTKEQVDRIAESCRMVAIVLHELEKEIEPGVNTHYLNERAEIIVGTLGGTPGFKGYRGYPYSICASVNDQIVHGFPNKEYLRSGSILSIDFGVLYNGWYGDAAFTKCVGSCTEEVNHLLKVTETSLYAGIEKAVVGNRIGDISNAIQTKTENEGFNVIRDYTGHGIGAELHEEPPVPNFGVAGEGYGLKPGMVIAIEPMAVTHSNKCKTLTDGWTTKTIDGGWSAHFEHTIAITENGPRILTDRSNLT